MAFESCWWDPAKTRRLPSPLSANLERLERSGAGPHRRHVSIPIQAERLRLRHDHHHPVSTTPPPPHSPVRSFRSHQFPSSPQQLTISFFGASVSPTTSLPVHVIPAICLTKFISHLCTKSALGVLRRKDFRPFSGLYEGLWSCLCAKKKKSKRCAKQQRTAQCQAREAKRDQQGASRDYPAHQDRSRHRR